MLLLGIVLMGLGALLLASQIVGFDFYYYVWTYWPVVIILFGIIRLFDRKASKAWSVFWIGLGTVFLLNKLHVFTADMWTVVLSLLLIIAGFAVIASLVQNRSHHKTISSFGDYAQGSAEAQEKNPYYHDQDALNDRFLFTQEKRIYRSDTFSGGDVEVSFANVFLDLRNVWPLTPEIHMDVKVNFGALEIDVPQDWHVVVDGKHYYAHSEVDEDKAPSCTLIVDSKVFAGSFKIV